MKKVILILVILTFACKDKKSNKAEIKTKVTQQTEEIKYVTAKSGLIYRDKPKGKRLGKFEFNQKVIISEHTKVFQDIKNEGKTINGEWVGINLNNKIVYVFGGFLSDKKTKITPELIKRFMGNKIWFSVEFKTILETTKSLSKAYIESECFTDVVYSKEENMIFFDKQFMEPFPLEEPFKITDINNETLIIKDKNKEYKFLKSNVNIHPIYILGGGDTASYHFFKQWFKGSYIFKIDDKTKKYNSKEIRYYIWDNNDIVKINKKTYKVDEVIDKTYYLSEIQPLNEEDAPIIPTGKKATLTKIN